jgi:hypothetical protein
MSKPAAIAEQMYHTAHQTRPSGPGDGEVVGPYLMEVIS